MVDPIDPVAAKVNAGMIPEAPKVEPVAMTPQRRTTDPAPVAALEATARRDGQAAAREALPHPGLEVHLDGSTLRLYSEMRDPETKKVMLRIPTGYQPKTEPPRDYTPTEIET